MSKKSYFNMSLTETQRKIIDYIMYKDFGANITKADYFWLAVKSNAMRYTPFCDLEPYEVSDELVWEGIMDSRLLEEKNWISMLGVANYKKILEDHKRVKDYDENFYNMRVKVLDDFIKEHGEDYKGSATIIEEE